MGSLAFGRVSRVRKASEYRDMQRDGRKVYAPHFFLVYLARPAVGLRLGLIVGRKVGKAHDRNRIKRWTREFFRLRRADLSGALGVVPERGFDLVVGAKPGAAALDHPGVDAELDGLFRRLADQLARTPKAADPGPAPAKPRDMQ